MGTEAPAVTAAVARELRAGLARRKMSHADLARAVALPERTVNRALRGETHMTVDHYVTLTVALSEADADDRRALVRALVGEIHRRSIA